MPLVKQSIFTLPITGAGRQLGLWGCEWVVPRRGGHPLPHPGGRQLGQHSQVTIHRPSACLVYCIETIVTTTLLGLLPCVTL